MKTYLIQKLITQNHFNTNKPKTLIYYKISHKLIWIVRKILINKIRINKFHKIITMTIKQMKTSSKEKIYNDDRYLKLIDKIMNIRFFILF